MKTGTIVAVAALVAAASAHQASAAFVNVKYLGKGNGQNVKITVGSSSQDVFAGQLKHLLSDADAPFESANGTHVTFCTDVHQYVSSNTSKFEFVPVSAMPDGSPMGEDKAAAIQKLYNGAAGAQLAPGATNNFAAAFQLAVWEVISDYNTNTGLSSINLTGGTFKAKKTDGSSLSSGVMSAFNTIIGYLSQDYQTNIPIMGIASGTKQDQIIEGVIPSPGAAMLAACGLGLVTLRRRTK